MKIQGKGRLRSVRRYLGVIGEGREFIVCHPIKGEQEWVRVINHHEDPKVGDHFLPRAVGPRSRRNAYGHDTPLRSEPKREREYPYYSTWKDFQGRPVSGMKLGRRKGFPKEHHDAPGERLSVAQFQDGLFLCSRSLLNDGKTDESALLLVNVFLELFGECELRQDNGEPFELPLVHRLDWERIPKGEYSWKKVERSFQEITRDLTDNARAIASHRFRVINSFGPTSFDWGKGGFLGYSIFGFEELGLYVFESHLLDNATYVFEGDPEAVLRLTKSKILKQHLHVERFFHDHQWEQSIKLFFHRRKQKTGACGEASRSTS